MKLILKQSVFCINKLFLVLRKIVNRLLSYWYSLQFKSCGNNFRIRKGTVIVSPENISIGDNFESMECLYMYGDHGEITIGNNVCINTNVQIGASCGRIIIGNDVLIAANVVIRSANHGLDSSQKINKQPHSAGDIIIEDDVWIGSNAVITSNIILKTGTVVGAGAVVTKSTEPYAIVAGVPARKISQRS